MTRISKGPVAAMMPSYDEAHAPRDCALRILTDYQIQTDEYVTRFDVAVGLPHPAVGARIGNVAGVEQWNGALFSSDNGGGALVIPKHLKERTLSLQVNGRHLVDVLRGLADSLEQELDRRNPEQSEAMRLGAEARKVL